MRLATVFLANVEKNGNYKPAYICDLCKSEIKEPTDRCPYCNSYFYHAFDNLEPAEYEDVHWDYFGMAGAVAFYSYISDEEEDEYV